VLWVVLTPKPHRRRDAIGATLPQPSDRPLQWYPCDCVICRDAQPKLWEKCRPGNGVVNPNVPGLVAFRKYASDEEIAGVKAALSQHAFMPYYGKTCQEYGLTRSFYIKQPTATTIPPEIARIGERLHREGHLPNVPDYILVNRYQKGEGIHPHVDDSYYDDGISSLVLGHGSTVMFHNTSMCLATKIDEGGIFIFQREARYKYKHEVLSSNQDCWEGNVIPRAERTAVTFRHVTHAVRDAIRDNTPFHLKPYY
jgi:alkylated DNA repair dioxygenase AlkB